MADEPEKRNTRTFEAPGRTAAGRRTVLVVDDDATLARSMSRLLERAGYEVTIANDGAEAVEKVTRQPFDVIVSDIQMPRMSGVDLLRVVRTYDLDVPVILMTGAPAVESAMEAVSLGALQYLPKPTPSDVLLKAVERASRLHRMAQMKREAIGEAGDRDQQAGDRAGLQTRFEHALETMWMAFQPVVDADRHRLFGYEALLRAEEPSLPHPGAILGAAERLDRLQDLGRHIRTLTAKAFQGAAKDALLFVNLHARDLLDPDLYLKDSPLAAFADRTVLEITERVAIDDVKDLHQRVSVLRYHGFRIAVDDLGAGYAGLSSFAALEPEFVKFDMSLVRGVHRSPIRRRLITSMASLCKEMGIRAVAEGVEELDERDCVLECGCELMQGYLFARPGPPFPPVEGTRRKGGVHG
jgi:EAL domain-containing protein (putative c-di-GMP-specific phosphodiesterase class I)